MKTFIKQNKYKLAGIVVLVITVLFYKTLDSVIFADNHEEETYDVFLRDIKQIPVLKEKITKDPVDSSEFFDINNLTSKAVYIEDVDTATQLFEKNKERLLLPASTTKIMTALVVRENYNLDDILVVPNLTTIGGSEIGLFKGEKLKVRDLLKAALIQSSNGSAYTLAFNYQEGLDGFVNLMNKKAKDLNLKSTFFENPVGFDSKQQRSSAHDLAILSKELMKDEFLRSVVGTKKTIITNDTGEYKHSLLSTNKLLDVDKTVKGIKTGTTQGASQVLITQFNREGRNILIVVMGSDDRYKETSKLIDWVFDNYVWLTPEQIVEKS